MKKFFFLIFVLFSCEVFAQDNDVQPNLLRALMEEDEDSFIQKASALFHPSTTNKFVADVNFDDNYRSTDKNHEFIDAALTARLYSSLNLTKNVAINSFFQMDSLDSTPRDAGNVNFPISGGNRIFEREAIHVEELNVSYNSKKLALVAGKFNLDYGTAWKWNRGIWTREIADNYRERQKLGFHVVSRLGDAKKTGQYAFGLSLFTNDRKNLDNSIISERNSDHKYDARPGDTRSLQSYAASLDINFDFGKKFGRKEKLSYHFAQIGLAVNSDATSVIPANIADQKGYVAGLNYEYPFTENLDLDALLEYEKTKNLNGDSNATENYFTSSLINKIHKNWNITLGYAQRSYQYVGQYGFDQNLSEISAGYDFDKTAFFDRLTIQLGYKNQRTDYKTNINTQNALGLLLRYYKNF